MRTVLILLALIIPGAVLVSAADPPEEKSPEYLDDLRSFAAEYLAADSLAVPIEMVPPTRSGPVIEAPTYFGAPELDGRVEADSVSSQQVIIQKVIVSDRDAIAYLYASNPFTGSSVDEIQFMEIYDVSRSGFSNGDLVVAHPSGESFILDNLDVSFLDAAATWTRRINLARDRSHTRTDDMPLIMAELAPPERGGWEIPAPNLAPDKEASMAIKAIGAGVHKAVSQQYGLSPIELYFARSDSATTVEIWSFTADSLRFQYLDPNGGGGHNDLLTVAVRDSSVRSYHSFVDMVVVRESRRDTFFTPPPSADRKTARPASRGGQ